MPINAANVTLRQLAALVAVVDHGGFAAAAGPLNMTQSAVSQAIGALERAVGAPLLTRERQSSGRVRPTALGEAALDAARAALRALDDLAAAARALEASRTGTLRLASIRSVAATLLAPALTAFRRRYPQVAVTLWEGTDREVHHWLATRAVDVGFAGPLLSDFPGATLVRLVKDPFYVVLPIEHALARRARLSLTQLADVPYIMSDGGCEPAIRRIFAAAAVEPRVTARAQSTDTLLAMVAAGVGATLVPELGLACAAQHAIRAVPLEPRVARTVTAVIPDGDGAPPTAVQFLTLVEQHVARTTRRVAS